MASVYQLVYLQMGSVNLNKPNTAKSTFPFGFRRNKLSWFVSLAFAKLEIMVNSFLQGNLVYCV